jgi:MGT family glycosyltransferase
VGPVFEGDEEDSAWDLPWPPDHPDPLVAVSFSTTYMYHEAIVGRILAALEALPVRVLLTLGGGLEPHEVTALPDVVVRPYIPHPVVLPHASLVVTHAGMGTVMAAFAYGVPLVCVPLGRDQVGNAERVEALGAGHMIAPDAPVKEVRAAIVDVLGSDALRAGARRMAEIVAGYGRGERAIAELESLLASPRSA